MLFRCVAVSRVYLFIYLFVVGEQDSGDVKVCCFQLVLVLCLPLTIWFSLGLAALGVSV